MNRVFWDLEIFTKKLYTNHEKLKKKGVYLLYSLFFYFCLWYILLGNKAIFRQILSFGISGGKAEVLPLVPGWKRIPC